MRSPITWRPRTLLVAGALCAAAAVLATLLVTSLRPDPQTPTLRADGTTSKAVVEGCKQPLTLPGLGTVLPQDLYTCRQYDRGRALARLDQTAFHWDAACVARNGGTLRADTQPGTADNESGLTFSADGTLEPWKFGQCVVLTPSLADCDTFRTAFSRTQLSARQAAILERLGCSNTELRPLG